MASFAAIPFAIYANSVGNVIALTGSGTIWSGGTTFTVSGGNGAAITAQAVNTAISANITLNAGIVAGPLTISDGIRNTIITVAQAKPVTSQFPPPGNQRIALQQNQTAEISWAWADGLGNPVNLAGKTVKLTAWDPTLFTPTEGVFQETATISGSPVQNVATVTFSTSDTAMAAVLSYELLDVTDNAPICTGTLEIQPTTQTAP
jgi:hypothetical protein